MKACFMGLGYIGLPTAIIAAKHGVQVTGVDINKMLLSRLMLDTCISLSQDLKLCSRKLLMQGSCVLLHSQRRAMRSLLLCLHRSVAATTNLTFRM